jgi:regulator of replication initiation timing
MTENKQQIINEIGLLNVRIGDMMTQLNTTLKTIMDENTALKQENAALKEDKQEKTSIKP